ncbi:MAG: STAS domain-containing protein [Planctomycetes bacterium]|nr:STAS domain-containing protein [Planctomycetota bacterium]MCH9726596.1 STAS domain-containing protein [Planctomycetota bacterium]MCH9779265.1 STAS domain-containing protein [Planctomycetota bacterium]MDF1745545.1 STAS domain-containing protein [Gimesia sp.]
MSAVQLGGILQVYHAGPLCVAGFGGRDIVDTFSVNDVREELLELVKTNNCETLAIDLTGVKLLPSGMLGLLASMRDLNLEIHLYNPSEDIREVLEITKLNQFMQLHDVEIPY